MKTYLPTYQVTFKASGLHGKIGRDDEIFKEPKVLIQEFNVNSLEWIEKYLNLEYIEPKILSVERI